MAYLKATPQEEIQQTITQAGDNAKQAMLWFLVIGLIVVFIMFGTKK